MTQAEIGLPAITASALDGVKHAFFTREGGVSTGVYASLNGGVGSRDDPAAVAENRRLMAAHLGCDHLLVPYQIHSADCLAIEACWAERPRADALATYKKGLAIGVTGADCGIVLFADRNAGVVAAAHAGWQGAIGGILEATLATMEGLGAKCSNIVAVLGPCIAQPSYEVGPEFVTRFTDRDPAYSRWFEPSSRADHALFDLHGFIGHRLTAAGVGSFVDLGFDTYAEPRRFFSFRRMTHRGDSDYGRLIAAIAL